MIGPVHGLKFVHEAIRNGVAELNQGALALANSYSIEAAKELLNKSQFLGRVIDLHSASEDGVLFPAIDEKNKDATATFYDDQKKEKQLFKDILDPLLQVITNDRSNWVEEIKTVIYDYSEFLCSHMEREEKDLWPIVDQHYSPQEQVELMRRVGSFFKPEDLAQILPWIVSTLKDPFRNEYIQMIKKTFPEPVFENAKEWIREGVSDAVWNNIEVSVNS